jgi:CubicO group peptidase (beta-lactamase class C family)
MSYQGEVLVDQSFGLANTRLQQPCKTTNYHRIASISKTFTKAAILGLIEQGKLKLETKVMPEIFEGKFNYSICKNAELITIEHLLYHKVGSWPTTTRDADPMFKR